MNISQILAGHARYRSGHEAFVYEGRRWTFNELHREVIQMARAFMNFGITKGDKVATILPNTPELWMCYWACAEIGAVVVPLSPLLREQGLINVLNGSDTKLLLTKKAMVDHIDPVRQELSQLNLERIWLIDDQVGPYESLQRMTEGISTEAIPPITISGDDLYNIVYTSGTTGQPKGIMLSHEVRARYMTLYSCSYRIVPESVVLHTGSIIFNGSFLTTMPAMYQGCKFVLAPGFDVESTLRLMQTEQVTHTILVPSQIIQMLEHPDFRKENLPHLEMILTVGAPLDKVYKEKLQERIPDVFYELYGLTEGFMTILDKTEAVAKMGSVGKPPQFFEMRIVDENGQTLPQGEVGEIIGRCPLQMQGYYQDPQRTAEAVKDGWLYTGDLGYVDADGYLYLAGRKKDLIISGGVNVYPADIEAIVLRHHEVLETAVFGVTHDKWGETPIAAVVLRNPSISSEELKIWINDHLHVRYQKVSDVIIMESFPRNVAGKILKRKLQSTYENKSKAI